MSEWESWSGRWVIPNAGVRVSLSRTDFGGVAEARLEELDLHLRARGVEPLAEDDAPIDIDMRFLCHPGDAPLLELDLLGRHAFVIPGETVFASRRWESAGIIYEDWLARIFLGSLLTHFPCNVDLSDLIAFTRHDGEESRITAASLQLAERNPQSIASATLDAFLDVRDMLLFQQCDHPLIVFAVYHGAWRAAHVHAIGNACREFEMAPAIFVGQDDDPTLKRNFVSLIAAGVRS